MVSRGKVNILDKLIAHAAVLCLVLSFSFKPVYAADAPTEGSSGGEASSSSGSSSASGSSGAGGAGAGGAGGAGAGAAAGAGGNQVVRGVRESLEINNTYRGVKGV